MTDKLSKYCKISIGMMVCLVSFNLDFFQKSLADNTIESRVNNFEFDSILYLEKDIFNYSLEDKKISFPDTTDGKIFQDIINKTLAQNIENRSFSKIIQTVAIDLLGAKYESGLLDRTDRETLFVSLEKFDCLLFVETVIALAKNITNRDYNYDNFTNNVAQQRYRQGKMTDYCSRLHYFSHWIADNEQRKLVTNITPSLGGVTINKKLNFMTSHRNSYRQLIKNDKNYQCIAEMEKSLEKLTFNYLPTHNIRSIYNQLKPGDIVGIATNIKGLDFTHTGLVYQDKQGNIGLIHASPAGQVVIATDLQYYVQNVRNAIGIVVARPNK